MAFHESFWVATSTAAPVIALAAVVALPDASRTVGTASRDLRRALEQRQPDNRADPVAELGILIAREYRQESRLIWAITLLNLIAQAGLLAISLWALAYEQDYVPPRVAVVIAICGILLLAWSTLSAFNFPKFPHSLLEAAREALEAAGDSRDQDA